MAHIDIWRIGYEALKQEPNSASNITEFIDLSEPDTDTNLKKNQVKQKPLFK